MSVQNIPRPRCGCGGTIQILLDGRVLVSHCPQCRMTRRADEKPKEKR